jgi:hypothetical protein
MSSPPWRAFRPGAGVVPAAGFSTRRARVGPEALDQNPQAAPCEELGLAGLTILLRRVSVRGEGIGGGPVHHAGLTQLVRLAGPSAPKLRHAPSWVQCHSAHFTACRATLAYAPN